MNAPWIPRRFLPWTLLAGLALASSVSDCKKSPPEDAGATGAGNAGDVAAPPTLQAAASAAIAAQPPAPSAPPDPATDPAGRPAPGLPAPGVPAPDKPFLSPRQQLEALAARMNGGGGGLPAGLGVPTGMMPATGIPGGAATGPDPCDVYVARFMACQDSALAGMNDPELIRMMEDAVREGCDGLRSFGDAALSAAFAACASAPCGEAGAGWMECVGARIAEAVAGGAAAAPGNAAPVGPAAPPPSTAAAGNVPPACLAYADRMLECMMGTAAAGGLPPEVFQESRIALLEGCSAIRDTGPEIAAAFERAVVACADAPCGEGGSAWTQCITDRLTQAMIGQP
ncbi:MAG: hypothetical protein HY907_07890 [Deltaproteobacteria bacterium]|nr:hypothetical protein [Deltaproteobacteria bacterium]